VNTKGFRESGAYDWNLNVESSNYLRSSLRIGAGLTGEAKQFRWHCSMGLDCLVSGRNKEIISSFIGAENLSFANQSFKSRSVTLGLLQGECNLGGGYFISENVQIYTDVNLAVANNYKDFYGNLGVKYSFDNWLGKARNITEINTGKEVLRQFRINAALFDVDKSDIKPEAMVEIAKLARQIKKYNYKKIRIEGHTDSTASDEYNYKLSLARAAAVCKEFLKYGIPNEKMEEIGCGEKQPIYSNKTKRGRALNRRVEVFIDLF
jgi:outer membrane protein OmpA-like peptidoglycan-associated protein